MGKRLLAFADSCTGRRMRDCCIALYLLNLLDYLLTVRLVYWLGLGVDAEANKLMAAAFAYSPWAALFAKVFCVGGLVLFLYREQEHRLARRGVVGLLGVYLALALYHMLVVFTTL